MTTTSELLNQLITDKKTLVTNLTTKGIECSNEETFTQLVPKVLDITAGIDTSDADATADDIKSGKTAYVDGEKLTGSMYTRGKVTAIVDGTKHYLQEGYYAGIDIPGDENLIAGNIKKDVTIYGVTGELETSGGIDTSDATATADDLLLDKTAYVDGKKITGTIESIESNIYTPTIEDQIIPSKKYLSGDQTIKGDPNLLASNIKKGVTIFGVDGIYEGSGSSSASIVFNCSEFSSVSEVYNAYKDITKVSNDGKLEVFDDLTDSYNYQIVSPIYNNSLAGINLNTSTANAAFYLTTPVTITSTHTLFKFIYYVSVWINPTIQIALISADSIEEIPTKITAGEFAWTTNIILSNTNNKKSTFYEFDNIPLGEYYIMINAANKFSANEGIINYISFLGL